MEQMFYYYTTLTSLYISSFNTAKVTNMDNMFGQNSKLAVVYVGSGWKAASSNSAMFSGCKINSVTLK